MFFFVYYYTSVDDEISTSNRSILYSPIVSTCWTWWWPPSRPKHVVLLTTLPTDNKLVVFLTSLHCTFMLHTQRGCLNSRLVRTFLTFYATRRFTTVFTTARHLSLLSTRRIQHTLSSYLSNSSLRDKNSPPPPVFHLHPPWIRLNYLLTSLPYFEWYSHNAVTGSEEGILGHCYCPFC